MKILIYGSTQLPIGETLADLMSIDDVYEFAEWAKRDEALSHFTPDKVSVLESAMKDPKTAIPKIPSKYQIDYFGKVAEFRYDEETDTLIFKAEYRVYFGGGFYWLTRYNGEVWIRDSLAYRKYTEIQIHSDNSYDISTMLFEGEHLEEKLSDLRKFEASPDGMYIISKREKGGQWFSGICKYRSQIEDLAKELNNGRPINPKKFVNDTLFD